MSQQILDPFVAPLREPLRLVPRELRPGVFRRVPISPAPPFAPARLRLVIPDHLEGGRRRTPAASSASSSVASPVRLTARGRLAVVVAVALAAIGVLLALVLLPSPATAPAGAGLTTAQPPASVVVQPGDTLWSIATRVAPKADPRVTVQHLIDRNRLAGSAITPGEALAVS